MTHDCGPCAGQVSELIRLAAGLCDQGIRGVTSAQLTVSCCKSTVEICAPPQHRDILGSAADVVMDATERSVACEQSLRTMFWMS